ncbi:uncharacterized protein LOC107423434 isoform X4 [Ziziphus jujuba]|uniref:Uncharacterized protein LOC107423434 isoform X4 n=1 Tax=Ziziphus jujuba TaxID=326968 RepID=A0ABM4AD36_ZIZJJ|nr:uncharacterized protein LOC107423434 isoform X4 [Ziziphus jujuba]XP_060674637.1 uncharacterized protein LOC107423434 isoform X4 [Ziziphus jujuba]
MESRSSGSAISIPSSSSSRPPKRLLFDRRYGWVIDEWKDPSEEALAGGRGMFCILPLAKALLKMASQSVELSFHLLPPFSLIPCRLMLQQT